ncbi:MAG TPA: M1 family aminopeptidase [Polyangiaceae bacterium]|nr:M1 family aminopeptidase [Polyangiaceae bacterium]
MSKLAQRLHSRCACSSAGSPFALAGTERKYERSRPFAIPHLALDLVLDFENKSVSGSATLDFSRVAASASALELDAVGFELESVRLNAGKGFVDTPFDYDGDTLIVRGLERADNGKVEIRYRATPRRGMYFLEPDAKVKNRPKQVWTQCQDEDARHFIPCHDKPHVKMTSELRVTVPNGFVALSNGELVDSQTPGNATKKPWTYHFRLDKPHPSYLLTLVAGNFTIIDDRPAELADSRQVPVQYYVPPARKKDTARSFGETPRMIELFSRLTGVPFPWQRYSQIVVSDFIFGGMENTTATTMYEHVLLDERAVLDISSNDLVAHELAHQWFGDFVTCRDWSHAWLNEGFATFMEHVEREDRLGRDEYDYGVSSDNDTYLHEASARYSRPIVCRDYAEPIDLFDRHLYEKGGLVLHMLRRELGDEVFWTGVRNYLQGHAYSVVETNDLQRALEKVSGRSLERFFDSWVYRPGHPELKVKVSWDDGLLSIGVKQGQKLGDTAEFHFELELEIGTRSGGVSRHKKAVSAANDTFVVALAERPAFVAFDPELRVLGEHSFEAPSDMLRAQLTSATHAISRVRAADALSRRDDPPTIEALAKSLSNKAEAWMVRAEAARALGKIRSEQAFSALAAEASVEHPKVRRAVAAALGNFKTAEAAKILEKRAKSDPSYLVEAESVRSLGRTRQAEALPVIVSLLDRGSWAEVSRAGALDALGALRDERALPEVLKRTEYGFPTRGRRAAIAALPLISESRKVREHLEDLLEDKDPHLKIDVVAALQFLGDLKSRGPLHRAKERELDGRVVRRLREALRDMGEHKAVAERKRLNEELDGVRGELSELKARLSRLEASKGKSHSPEKPAKSSAKSSPSSKKKTKKKVRR